VLSDYTLAAVSNNTNSSVSPIWLGIISTLLIVIFTMLYSSYYDVAVYTGWVAFVWMTAVPAQIIFGLHMNFNSPKVLANLPQPLKGGAFCSLTFVLMIVGGGYLYFVPGGGMAPPGPFLIMATITTIVAVFWLVAAWQCWPFTLISRDPFKQGLMALVASFALGHLVYYLSFDFSFMVGSTEYIDALDPKGFFNAWYALAFSVTTVAAIMLLSLFENWPVTKFSSAQPLLGMAVSIVSLVISTILFWLAVFAFEMDPVDYMVRLPVSIIFGVFIVTNMMQFQLFKNIKQPLRGLYLLLVTLFLVYTMQLLYRTMATYVVEIPLMEGAPRYEMELWVATALLSITFPVINLVSGYLSFWPLKR